MAKSLKYKYTGSQKKLQTSTEESIIGNKGRNIKTINHDRN